MSKGPVVFLFVKELKIFNFYIFITKEKPSFSKFLIKFFKLRRNLYMYLSFLMLIKQTVPFRYLSIPKYMSF